MVNNNYFYCLQFLIGNVFWLFPVVALFNY